MKNKSQRKKSILNRLLSTLLLCFCTVSMYAQQIEVSGVVVDVNGLPLIGVNVMEAKTTNGTITDIDGNFVLKCDKKSSLHLSYVGYMETTAKVSSRKMRIVMKEDITSLNEVVVVGYGVQKKRDITGSIISVSDNAIKEKQPVNIFQALQGEAPGLQISNSSGAPGDTGTMLIRGASTMGEGVNPLFIVDGVPTEDISYINPSDIKSMEVLKDAASAAIYGSRSAAGVIIISTKRGAEGTPINVSAKYNHSMKSLNHKIPQSNAFDRIVFEARRYPDRTSLWSTKKDEFHPCQMADNDYQDLITRLAHSNQLDVSLSGSKNKMNYYTSVGLLDDKGIVINSFYKRITVRTNIDYRANDRFKLMSRFNVAYTHKNNINVGRVFDAALKRPPQMTLYFPDGSYIYKNGGQRNPIAYCYENVDESKVYNAQLYQGAEFKILKNLIWTGNVQANYQVTRRDQLRPGRLEETFSEGGNKATLARKLAAETYISWNQDFKDHNVNAMFGASVEDWYDENFGLMGSDYISDEILSSNAQVVKDLTETVSGFTDHAMAAFFGRLGYSYKGRYIFTSNLRYDGSSRFSGNRWGFFPSASGAWRLSDESFMRWAKPVLTDAKFRVSWGMTGNERVGNYDTINSYNIGAYYNAMLGVYQNGRMANKDLSWEATEQTNIGLDLTMLDGRVSFVADYYIKNTHDLLSLDKMPSELGVNEMRVNFGKIQNRGIELSLSAYPVKTKDFSWKTNLNYSKNKNKVVSLFGGMPYVENGMYWIEEGAPLGQWYGWEHQGIYPTDAANAYVKNEDGSFGAQLVPVFKTDPDNYNNMIYGSNGSPIFSHYETQDGQVYDGEIGRRTSYGQVLKGGDVIWEDRDNDGVIGDKDRKVLGQGMPTWYMGWSNYLTYKNWSLSFSFYGSFGNKIYNKQRKQTLEFKSNNLTPYKYDIHNIWKYQGQYSDLFKGNKANTGVQNARELSSYCLENGNYIRLTNIRLSYTLDKKWSNKLMMKDLTLYVYGNNLMTWTNYRGYDPSSISDSNVLHPGLDNGRYPTAKEVGFGLNVNF